MALRMRSTALSSSRAAGSGSTGRRRGSGAASSWRGHDVLGQLEVSGAGLLGLCHLEGLAHDLGDDLRARHARVPLGDGPEQLDEVDELMGLLVHPLEVGLAGEGDERRAVQEGVADRGDEVHGPGAQRAQADAGAPGEAPVHVGHVGPALLVSNRDEGDRGARQRLVEVEGLLAGDPEDVLDPFGLQAFDEHVAGAPVTLSHRMQPSTATRPSGGGSGRGMRKLVLALVAALLLAAAPAAQRRDEADHHRRRLRPRHRHEPVRHVRLLAAPQDLRLHPRATTTRAPRWGRSTPTPRSRSCCRAPRSRSPSPAALNAGDQKLDPAQTYSVRRTAAGLDLRDATRQERGHGRRDPARRRPASARRCA